MSRVLESILKHWPADRWITSTIVLAVSGGPDSVALLRAVDAINRSLDPPKRARLVVAHLNHRLRGDESDCDEAFVKTLARGLQLEAVSDSIPTSDARQGEAFWRQARVAFLKDVAKQFDAQWIATGATADDNIETMLHHLLRGSGPAGLAGIRLERRLAENLTLVHPLVSIWKSELLEFLASLGQPFRIDHSNLSDSFTRNRIRNECLPYLEKFMQSDQLKYRLQTTSELIRQEHEVIEQLAAKWLESHAVRQAKDHIEMNFEELSNLPWPVLQCGLVDLWHRMHWPLQQIGFRHWDRVRHWIHACSKSSHPKRMQLPGPIELRFARKVLKIRRPS